MTFPTRHQSRPHYVTRYPSHAPHRESPPRARRPQSRLLCPALCQSAAESRTSLEFTVVAVAGRRLCFRSSYLHCLDERLSCFVSEENSCPQTQPFMQIDEYPEILPL